MDGTATERPLHPTQFGNHIKDGRHRATHINPEVQKLVDSGMSIRTAYRTVEKTRAAKNNKPEFDYDKETPKGEWV
jgi:hypothetical protein